MTQEIHLNRAQAAEYVRAKGLPCARSTLQKYVTVGGGPLFRRFGGRSVYSPEDLDAWIAGRLSKRYASTSGAQQ